MKLHGEFEKRVKHGEEKKKKGFIYSAGLTWDLTARSVEEVRR